MPLEILLVIVTIKTNLTDLVKIKCPNRPFFHCRGVNTRGKQAKNAEIELDIRQIGRSCCQFAVEWIGPITPPALSNLAITRPYP